jgi:hypothetical protein
MTARRVEAKSLRRNQTSAAQPQIGGRLAAHKRLMNTAATAWSWGIPAAVRPAKACVLAHGVERRPEAHGDEDLTA